MALRIVIADDHKIVRESFRALLESDSQFEVIADVSDGEIAVTTVLSLKPDIVVMDMTMPNLNGVEATRQILKQLPDTRIIALSMHSHPRFVLAMLRAGAAAYILKTSKAQELIKAIRTVAKGKSYISEGLEMRPEDSASHDIPSPECDVPLAKLSSRERQVLTLIADGYDSHAIGSKLGVANKTVSTHREHIMSKLHINNIAGLTKYAVREGLSSI
ncbi:MAG: response regulator transcription factor [bacterium]